jgi:hypothetical protein
MDNGSHNTKADEHIPADTLRCAPRVQRIVEIAPMRYVIRERFFRLGEDSDITDESGNPVLREHIEGSNCVRFFASTQKALLGPSE